RQRGYFILGAVIGVARKRRASSHEGGGEQCEHEGDATIHRVTLIASSLSWRGSTSDGAPLIGSTALPVLGKARTSRSESVPHSTIHSRSTPKAHPPCGGAP